MKSKSSCSIYEGVEKFDSYIEHHGITGQKWGVRHGPPYPLESTTSGRVKSQGQINKYLKDRQIARNMAVGRAYIDKFQRVGTAALLSEHDQVWEERFTSVGNQYIKQLATDGQAQTSFTYQNYKYNGNDEVLVSPVDAYREAGARSGIDLRTNKLDNDRILEVENIIEKGLINPGWKDQAPGCTQNCTKNMFAIEAAQRGLNGVQAGRQTFPASSDAPAYWFKGAHRERCEGDDALTKASSMVGDFGERASGALSVYNDVSGHMLHWTSRGGVCSIEDGQCGEVYTGFGNNNADAFADAFSRLQHRQAWDNKIIDITRLDNCEINWENASEDGCLRGNKVWNHETGRIVDRW